MLETVLKITLVIFMFGNMLHLGLRLELRKALQGLRDVRFVTLALSWGYIVCPALGYLMAVTLPLSPPYAMALILVAMAPGTPFLPTAASKARTDLNFVATFMPLQRRNGRVDAIDGTAADQGPDVELHGSLAKPMLVLILLPHGGWSDLGCANPWRPRFSHWSRKPRGYTLLLILGIAL